MALKPHHQNTRRFLDGTPGPNQEVIKRKTLRKGTLRALLKDVESSEAYTRRTVEYQFLVDLLLSLPAVTPFNQADGASGPL